MFLYHISKDKVDIFTPRIPKDRLEKENDTIKRICLSKCVEGCLTAIPYGINHLIETYETYGIPSLVYLYKFDTKTICKENLLSSKYLKDTNYVDDANYTKEHWVINQDLKVEDNYKVINIISSDVKVIEVNEYEKIDFVYNLRYENEIEDYDRTYNFKFFQIENCLNLVKIIKKEKFKIIDSYKDKHSNYCVKFLIPAKSSCKKIWGEYMKYIKTFYDKTIEFCSDI